MRARVPFLALVSLLAPWVTGCHWGLVGLAFGASSDQGRYEWGTIASELGPASVRTVGCLDLGLAIEPRGGAELLDVRVGNRCTHPEALDLRRLALRGFDDTGSPLHVALVDPRGEIVLRHVGGEERGRELVRLDHGPDPLERVCFDFDAAVTPDAPQARPASICFRRDGGVWSAQS